MRIVLDFQGCQSESRVRGIGRYSLSLSQAIARQAKNHEVFLLLNDFFPQTIEPIKTAFKDLIPAERILVFKTMVATQDGAHFYHLLQGAWQTKAAELIREHYLASLNPDVVHVSSIFELETVVSVNRLNVPFKSTATLYDLIPLLYSKEYLAEENVRQWYYRGLLSLKRADATLAISEFTRQQAAQMLSIPEVKIINISAAADSYFSLTSFLPTEKEALCAKHGITKPFILYTGGAEWRKNIAGLITAFADLPIVLRQQYQLVVVCKMVVEQQKQLESLMSNLGLVNQEVIFTNYVPDDQLRLFYQTCALFVFPSFCEGFGLPVLEAMACGAPTIGSNTSGIPEVVGRADALFDPTKPEAIAKKMAEVLTDENFRHNLVSHGLEQAKRFSWDISAQKAITAFEALFETQKAPDIASISLSRFYKKPRLAFVSPLPPEKTGIANYSAELLPELAKFYDIEVIVAQQKVTDPWVMANFPIRNLTWFEQHALSFDRIVYQMGNSSFHSHMFKLIAQYPGIVVLHDFYLSGVIFSSTRKENFLQTLYGAHGYEALLFEKQYGASATIQKYPCSKQIFDCAMGVIVHSSYAKDLAQHYYGIAGDSQIKKIEHLRAVPPLMKRQEARNLLNIAEDAFVVCSFGFIAATKLNHRLLDAWLASSLAKNKKCKLVFVGEILDAEYGNVIVNKIKQTDAIATVTGYTDATLYQTYLAAADIAVQLRANSRGETSGTTLDALVAGLPLVINSCGSNAELPEEVVYRLEEDFTDVQLSQSLEELLQDIMLRQKLSLSAVEYIRKNHHPAVVGEKYKDAIENFMVLGSPEKNQQLLAAIAEISCDSSLSNSELYDVAKAVSRIQQPSLKQLLCDITVLLEANVNPETQTKVRNKLLELLADPPQGFRVEPILHKNGEHYYARELTLKLLDLSTVMLQDELMQQYPGDTLLHL